MVEKSMTPAPIGQPDLSDHRVDRVPLSFSVVRMGPPPPFHRRRVCSLPPLVPGGGGDTYPPPCLFKIQAFLSILRVRCGISKSAGGIGPPILWAQGEGVGGPNSYEGRLGETLWYSMHNVLRGLTDLTRPSS
jgi:hypothetical protein